METTITTGYIRVLGYRVILGLCGDNRGWGGNCYNGAIYGDYMVILG